MDGATPGSIWDWLIITPAMNEETTASTPPERQFLNLSGQSVKRSMWQSFCELEEEVGVKLDMFGDSGDGEAADLLFLGIVQRTDCWGVTNPMS